MTAPSTPRVAESIDDLRVGQVVAWKSETGKWFVNEVDIDPMDGEIQWAWNPVQIILSDPPPEPVSVSREAFDALAEAIERPSRHCCPCKTADAASALVDEVRATNE